MSAARGADTLSIIRSESATVNQQLIASAHGWRRDTESRRRARPDQPAFRIRTTLVARWVWSGRGGGEPGTARSGVRGQRRVRSPAFSLLNTCPSTASHVMVGQNWWGLPEVEPPRPSLFLRHVPSERRGLQEPDSLILNLLVKQQISVITLPPVGVGCGWQVAWSSPSWRRFKTLNEILQITLDSAGIRIKIRLQIVPEVSRREGRENNPFSPVISPTPDC